MYNIFAKTRKAAVLATILSGCIIGSTACAADLLMGIPSNYATSQFGTLTGSRVKSEIWGVNEGVISSLNRDPSLRNVHINGKSMAFLRQYNYSTTNLIPNVLMNPNAWPVDYEWNKQETSKDLITGVLPSVPNPHYAVSQGNTIYVTGYDLGQIGIVLVKDGAMIEQSSQTINLMDTIKEYTGVDYKAADAGAWAHGEGLAIRGDYLYVLVTVNPHGGYAPYDDSYVLQYKITDGGLSSMASDRKNLGYVRMGKNGMSGLDDSFYNDYMFAAFCGGPQNYGYPNEETKISWGRLADGELSHTNAGDVIVPEAVKNDGAEFRDMQILPNGTAYIFKFVLSGTSECINKPFIYKTTVSNLMSKHPEDWELIQDYTGKIENGWFGEVLADYYTKRIYAEVGNNIFVYTNNGADPELKWETKDFSTNKQHYQWNSIEKLKNDLVWGPKAVLGVALPEGLTAPSVTSAVVKNPNAQLLDPSYRKAITGTELDSQDYGEVSQDLSNYKFNEDKTISLNKFSEGNLKTNVMAAIDASRGNDVHVDASGQQLQLQVKNSLYTPVGIYAGQGKAVTVDADKLNIITMGLAREDGGNSLTNAIWADGGEEGSSITINAPVNITMQGGLGGNGIATQKTDRWGENSHSATAATKITINGDVAIKGADSSQWGIDLNDEMVLSRFNNTGLLTTIDKSEINVNGNVDLDIYGNGIASLAEDSRINVRGGSIMVPLGMGYAYYTLAAYMGTINMNTGSDGTTPGTEAVHLDGDVFVLKDSGHLNLALTTKDSYLNGIVDNGNEANLYLQNDAQWINAATTTHYYQDDEDVGNGEQSHINNFYGGKDREHAGSIYQTVDSKALTMDNYSGNTNVFYTHDQERPSEILGGAIVVKHADAGSGMILKTDNTGIDTEDQDLVNEVLEGLAKKLYYTASMDGENNLQGKVEIVEGLTSQSIAKSVGTIDYNSNGQGYLNGIEEPEPRPDIVEPETVDMRGQEDKHYLAKDVLAQNYIFAYDKEKDNITSGKLYIGELEENSARMNIVIDAHEVDMTDNAAVIKAMDKALQQIVNEGQNSVAVKVFFTDGLVPGAEIVREYSGSYSSVNGHVGETEAINPNSINQGIYTTTITGNQKKDKEYAYNFPTDADVEYQLADNFELRKLYNQAEADGIQAAVKPDGTVQKLTLSHSPMDDAAGTIRLGVDVSGLQGAAAYGIYNTHAGKLELQDNGEHSNLVLKIKGAADGAGIYSVNEEGLHEMTLGHELDGQTNNTRVMAIDASDSRNTVEGISAGKNSVINVNYGKLQINAPGSGLHAVDGGKINALTYSYEGQGPAAYAERNGVININNWSDEEWQGAEYQDLQGDLVTDATGVINYNLRAAANPQGEYQEAAHTTWTGDARGNVNLIMDGGSTWLGNSLNNQVQLQLSNGSVWSTNGVEDNYLGYLQGAVAGKRVGAIRQQSEGDLHIADYSGSTAILYEHTKEEPQTILGGNTIIDKAAAASEITLITDNQGLVLGKGSSEAQQQEVNETLNALANKLYYTAYTTGEQNLKGQVMIAEGLTSSSASLRMEDISFDKETGRGSYAYTPEEKPLPPTPPVELTGPITGDGRTHDAIYTESGIWDEATNTYTFTQDTAINTIQAGVDIDGKDVVIDAGEHRLSINTEIPAGQGKEAVARGMRVHGNSLKVKNVVALHVVGDGPAVGIEIPGLTYNDAHEPLQGVPTQVTFAKDLNLQVEAQGQHDASDGVADTGACGIYVGNKASDLTVKGDTVVKVTSDQGGDAYGVVVADREVGRPMVDSAVINLQGADITAQAGTAEQRTYAAAALGGRININTDGTQAGSEKVVLHGDLYAAACGESSDGDGSRHTNGELNIALATTDSQLNGVIDNRSAKQSDRLDLGTVNLWLQKGATWRHEAAGYIDTENNVNTSYVTRLVGGAPGQEGVIYQNSAERDIVIDNYSGNTKVFYQHTTEAPANIIGGALTINKAEADSGIFLVTDNNGIDMKNEAQVKDTLDALSGKLYYTAFVKGENNLAGKVEIAEGLLTSSASQAWGDIAYDNQTGRGSLDEATLDFAEGFGPDKPIGPGPVDPDKPEIPEIIYGDSETAMMRGAKSAMASTVMLWRSESDNLLKRMGDLRLNREEHGVWAKYYGGKYSMDAQKADFESTYDAVQVGYDQALDENWITGIAFSYNDGESKYALGGKGDNTVTSLGIYGTLLQEDGQYLDLILKRSKLENEYRVYNDMHYKLDGDYDTWGTSFSAEYGKRFTNDKGFFLDPSLELTYGRVESSSYKAKSDYAGGKLMYVDQDGFDSLIGRASLRFGYADDRGSYYAKLGLAHEFSDDFTTTYAAEGEPTSSTSMDLRDTWYEIQVGATALLQENMSIYGSFERNFSADVTEKWRVDAGLRFTF